ncbi:hypothetical protein B0H17DRAFT_1059449 [Mycena rosella]|uniref:BZIP domain-containing protein n=1 Tax=Mycena rosella TaxID=1033263 RepID=A0AAD7DK76_MYCRO|nr:hypothetical protein B0H17DRAFT_1059449 [Mycena rosella]
MSSQRSAEDLTANDPPDLSQWEQLLFSLDMQNEHNPSGTNSMPQAGSHDAARPNVLLDIQTAALLAHLANSNMYPPPHNPSYPGAPQRQAPNLDFNPGPSNQRPFVSTGNPAPSSYSPYPLFHGAPPSPSHDRSFSAPSPTEATGGRSRAPRAPQAGPSTSTTSPDAEEDTDEYEDKRRRNTAASARFRIKKKQRTLDLERSVSDLTGRAEDLEREASDLRRENGWLKEIIMLKGGRLAGVNLSGDVGTGGTRRSGERRGKRRDSVEDDDSSSDQSDEDKAEVSGKKGKGKGKAKSKKK